MAELLTALKAKTARARRSAIERLPPDARASAAELRSFIQDGLGDEDFGVRWAASSWLRRATPRRPEIIGLLADSIQVDSEPQRRATAMETLGQLGAAAVDPLIAHVRNENPGVRRLAIDALGNTRAAAAGPALLQSAADADPAVRAAAVEALAKVGTPACITGVLAVLEREDESASVSLAALLAVESAGRALSAEVLARHAEHPVTAAVALRLLGRAGVLEPLVDNLVSLRRSRRLSALDGLYDALETHPELRARARALIPTDTFKILVEDPEVLVVARAAVVLARCAELRGLVALVEHPQGARELARAHVAAQAARQAGVTDMQFRTARESLRSPDGLRLFDEATERRAAPRSVGLGALEGAIFTALRDRICEASGLYFEPHAAERLAARLRPVARGFGHANWLEFIEALKDGVVVRAAIERVTVHETYFFREDRQLRCFVDRYLPEVTHSGVRRVWSAGCATGEEAWTLAMLLEESPVERWAVTGTDISPSVVGEARRGVYGRRSFRGTIPETLRERYFARAAAGERVIDALREAVDFHIDNLIEDGPGLRGFDAIFCRNVLIYLSPDARAGVIRRFYRALRPGGVLFLGHSESLLHTENPFEIYVLDREIAYRKSEGA